MTTLAATQQSVEALVAPALLDAGYELVEVAFADGTKTLRLTIDHADVEAQKAADKRAADAANAPSGVPTQGGISLDDCTKASRIADAALDAQENASLRAHHSLEVSSPGLERPLTKPAHYQRFVGANVRVQLRPGVQLETQPSLPRKLRGKLVAADDAGITLEVAPTEPSAMGASLHLLYDQLLRGNLIYEVAPLPIKPRNGGPRARKRAKEQ